jgi:N-acetylglutamate synthase-like GNAT family acetyltransferase
LELKTYDPAMERDIEPFFIECFNVYFMTFNVLGHERDMASIPDSYQKGGQFWCLYDEGKLIGTVAVRTIDESSKTAEIKRLYVSPSRQGEGLGKKLFEVALNFAKDSGFKKVCADTRLDRKASQHLMRSHGFAEVPRYNDNYHAELFFALDL